jgi:hypothetical protein
MRIRAHADLKFSPLGLDLRPGLCLLILSLAVLQAAILIAQPVVAQNPPSEYAVKAAYLYNFGKFVEWPDKSDENKGVPFQICVLGDDPFGSALEAALRGETIGGKGVTAKRIAKLQGDEGCRILFISSSEDNRLPEIFHILDKTSVLTVSDLPAFSDRGGMIQFIAEGNRIRFEVNLKSARDAGLVMRSELLKVALKVTGNTSTGS